VGAAEAAVEAALPGPVAAEAAGGCQRRRQEVLRGP
jgi:hypothetical protein